MIVDSLSATYLIAGFLNLSAASYTAVLKQKFTSLRRIFIFCAVATAVYAIGYGMELASSTLEAMLFWSKIQYIGIAFLPAGVLLLTVSYIGGDRWLSLWAVLLILAIPVIVLASRLTNDIHGLYYAGTSIDDTGTRILLDISVGPLYILHFFSAILSLIVSSFLLVRQLSRSAADYRNQTYIMLVATVLPFVGLVFYALLFGDGNLDINPLFLTGGIGLYAYAIYRYRLFDLVPIARDRVFEGMSDGILVFDAENRLADFNSAASRFVPALSKNQLGGSYQRLLSFLPEIATLVEKHNLHEVAIRPRAQEGEPIYLNASSAPLNKRKNRIGTIVTLTDVTTQMGLMKQLEEIATRDTLTGIPTRRYFEELASREVAKATRNSDFATVMMMDLDKFKNVNDAYGHAAGDEVLRHFTTTVNNGIRLSDIFGRYGGEEFVLYMPDANPGLGITLANRLCSSVASSTVEYEGRAISYTVSIGIFSTKPTKESNIESLLGIADQAMYEAKRRGRNQVVLFDDDHVPIPRDEHDRT